MGDIVNRTRAVATAWHEQVVWIRINVAYIKAELSPLTAENEDTAELVTLIRTFGEAFTRFCQEEAVVFVSARRAEVGSAAATALIEALRALRESFSPWFREYHAVVEETQMLHPHGLALGLLHACGAEMHQAHAAFRKIIADFIIEVESGQP